MKHKYNIIKSTLVLLTLTIISNTLVFSIDDNTEMVFIVDQMSTVRETAKIQNKPYFIYFTAKWCLPCKIMNETTFTNKELADYAEKNYISAKVNYEDKQGKLDILYYNISSYPSFVIFSPSGKILSKTQGALDANSMLNLLKSYNTSNPTDNINISPPKPIKDTSTPIVVSNPKPPKFTNHQPPKNSTPITNHNTPNPNKNITPKPNSSSTTDLFQFNVQQTAAHGYSLQVGVYADYGNVLKQVNLFQANTNQPILVSINQLNNVEVYKVFIGKFSDAQQAKLFKQNLSNQKHIADAFIKNLSELN